MSRQPSPTPAQSFSHNPSVIAGERPATNDRLVALENQLRSIEHELRSVAERHSPAEEGRPTPQTPYQTQPVTTIIDALNELKQTLEQAVDTCTTNCKEILRAQHAETYRLENVTHYQQQNSHQAFTPEREVRSRIEQENIQYAQPEITQQTFTVDAGPFTTLTEINQLEQTLRTIPVIAAVNLRGFAGSRAHLETRVDNPNTFEHYLHQALPTAHSISVDQIAHHTTIEFAANPANFTESELDHGR